MITADTELKILIQELKKSVFANDLQSYTIKEVAELLNSSVHTIYNMIISGTLEAYTIGVKGSKKPVYRITKEALSKYIKTRSLNVRKEVSYER